MGSLDVAYSLVRKKESSVLGARMMKLLQNKMQLVKGSDMSGPRARHVGTKSFERGVSSDVSVSIDVVQTGSSNFRADDWIRTSMDLFTRQVPFSIEPHRQYSRNAVIRTLSIGFGGRVRSQANIPVWQKPSELSFCVFNLRALLSSRPR